MQKQYNTGSNKNNSADIADSYKDKKALQPDEAIIDLPDVEDIPGQENIHPAPLGELADTTIFSDDEEGKGLFDDDELENNDSNVSKTEKSLLSEAADHAPSRDEMELKRATLDKTDFDNEQLDEDSFDKSLSGDDLDVANTEDDDANEEIGEEDEENNLYSLGGDNKD